MIVAHVPGTRSRHIILYALGTCGWCHKTKKLPDDPGVEYNYAYADQLERDEEKKAIQEVKAWNLEGKERASCAVH